MVDRKPRKIILPVKKQKQIISRTIKKMKYFFQEKSVERILIYGSLAKMKLGKYVKEYRGRLYSDIDVLIIANEKVKIPSYYRKPPKLPRKINKITGKIFDRYFSNFKIENKFEVHLHIFNPKIHNSKLALKYGWPVNQKISNKKAFIIYKKGPMR